MAYNSPNNTEADFSLESYTPPNNNNADFDLTDGEIFNVLVTEAAGVADTVARSGTLVRTVTENVGAAATATAAAGYTALVSQGVAVNDTVASSIGRFRSVAENFTLADTVSKAAGIGLTENFSLNTSLSKFLSRVVNQGLGLTGNVGYPRFISLTEGVRLGTIMQFGDVIPVMVAETLGIQDTSTSIADFARTIDQKIGVSAAFTRVGTFFRTFNETTSLNTLASFKQSISFTENMALQDNVTRVADYVKLQTQRISLNTDITTIGALKRTVTQGISYTDTMFIQPGIKLAENIGVDDFTVAGFVYYITPTATIGVATSLFDTLREDVFRIPGLKQTAQVVKDVIEDDESGQKVRQTGSDSTENRAKTDNDTVNRAKADGRNRGE